MRERLIVGTGLVVIAAAMALPGPAMAAKRYASRTGNGPSASCPRLHPCSITAAVGGAESGDQVLLKKGKYTLGGTLTINANITLAPAPHAKVTLASTGHTAIESFSHATIRDLKVTANDPGTFGYGLNTQMTTDVERCAFIVQGQARAAIFTKLGSRIRNTLIVGLGSDALLTGEGGAKIINDTTFATGANSDGLDANNGFGNPQKVTVRNSILAGASQDINAVDQHAEDEPDVVVHVNHSNFQTTSQFAPDARIEEGAGNQHQHPDYVNTLDFDFRQQPSSPTINQGSGGAGKTDFEGNPRKQDGVIDIGADESSAPLKLIRLLGSKVNPALKLRAPVKCPPANCHIDASARVALPGPDTLLDSVSRDARQGKRVNLVFHVSHGTLHDIKQAGSAARLKVHAIGTDEPGFFGNRDRTYRFKA